MSLDYHDSELGPVPEQASGTGAMDPVVPGRPAASTAKVLWVLGAVVLLGVLGVAAVVGSWWRSSPQPPTELLGLRSTESQPPATDVEQLAFAAKRDVDREIAPLPLSDAVALTDYAWIERLAGRWTLDLGDRAVAATFGRVAVNRVPGSRLTLDIFPVDGRGVPPFYTVLRRSENDSFLAFRDEDGQYLGLLDDLQAHGDDLISYRPGGADARRFGHRSPSSRVDDPDDPRGGPDIVRNLEADSGLRHGPTEPELEPKPVVIKVERRSLKELWRRAETLKKSERYDSLEPALDRVLASDPGHRKAKRWRSSLPKWRARQHKQLRSRLGDSLDELQEAVEDQDLDDAVDLWLPGARAATGSYLAGFFRRFDRTRVRYQLKSFEIDDGTMIFDIALTLEGFDGRQRSIETHPWRGRLYGEHFLDPFGG